MKRGFLNSAKAKKESLYPSSNDSSAAGVPFLEATSSSKKDSNFPNVMQMDYGKVDNTALPRNYTSSKLEIHENPAEQIDFDPAQFRMVFTTIPARYTGMPDDPDGHSEWMVHAATKRKVLTAPGYPKAPPKPRAPNLCVVKDTSTMGLGLFATADIKYGELIFSERPLIVYPRAFGAPHLSEEMMRPYSQRELKNIVMHETEKQMEYAIGRMNEEDRRAYKSLFNGHTEDGSGPLTGIMRTNGYGTNLHDGAEKTSLNTYGALGKLGSRINHSCLPNIKQDFEIPSFSIQYTATRDITAGEQLFYSYCGMAKSKAERSLELAPYGVVCKCSSCENATPESDKLRKEHVQNCVMYQIAMELSVPVGNGFSFIMPDGKRGGKIDQSFVNGMVSLQRNMLKEELVVGDAYSSLLGLIEEAYLRLGNREKAKEFRDMAGYMKMVPFRAMKT